METLEGIGERAMNELSTNTDFMQALYSLGESSECTETLLKVITIMLDAHKDDKRESLCTIDTETGEYCLEHETTRDYIVTTSEDMKLFIANHTDIVIIHTHPAVSWPSAQDFLASYKFPCTYCLEISPDGSFWKFKAYTHLRKKYLKKLWFQHCTAQTQLAEELVNDSITKKDFSLLYHRFFNQFRTWLGLFGIDLREMYYTENPMLDYSEELLNNMRSHYVENAVLTREQYLVDKLVETTIKYEKSLKS